MAGRALSVNLGGTRQSAAAQLGMLRWTEEIVLSERPKVIFAQETFPAWLAMVRGVRYRVIEGVERGWKVSSALIVDDDLRVRRLSQDDLPHLWYHGSYLATGVWTTPHGSPAILASVHASPAPADPHRYGWPVNTWLPEPRDGGKNSRWPNGRLWDSDLVLATLEALGDHFSLPVVAAGDLNESLLDDRPGETWGHEFFATAEARGLTAWLHREWRSDPLGERATRAGLQLDHVLVGRGGEVHLRSAPPPELDPWWADPSRRQVELSDHTPIWFSLAE